jgi:hypothetical protein
LERSADGVHKVQDVLTRPKIFDKHPGRRDHRAAVDRCEAAKRGAGNRRYRSRCGVSLADEGIEITVRYQAIVARR